MTLPSPLPTTVHEALAHARKDPRAHDVVFREKQGWYVKADGRPSALIPVNYTLDDFAAFGKEYDTDISVMLAKRQSFSFAAEHEDFLRIRVEVGRDVDGVSLTARLHTDEPMDFPALLLPEAARRAMELAMRGLLLIVGETGTGKSTIWRSFVNAVPCLDGRETITLEDPVEGRIRHYLVRQYDVSRDDDRASFMEFVQGLKHANRCNAAVVVVQEIRDAEAAEAALAAAESGALVIVTMHCGRSADAPDRLLALLDAKQRELARAQMGNTLVGILAPRLVRLEEPEPDKAGRVMVAEWLPGHPDVRLAIKQGDTKSLADFLLNAPGDASPVLLEDELARLVEGEHLVSLAEAQKAANDRDLLDERIATFRGARVY